jgi:peptidoglycan/xylan/chitin deacetylase (PgdA/CDA1 family)
LVPARFSPARRALRIGASLLALCFATAASAGTDSPAPRELHHRLDVSARAHARDVALTLDACGGAYDRALVATLVRLRVPATLFVTRRWLERNPAAVRELLAYPELFEFEGHGAEHVPAVIGRSVYGIKGVPDLAGLEREVGGGGSAVLQASGRQPAWYRGAGAAYDAQSQQAIARFGYRIAGFSLNADGGATLGAATVARRMRQATAGDIVIAHMNKPASGTAAGLAAALPELQARGIVFVKLSQAGGVMPTADLQARR